MYPMLSLWVRSKNDLPIRLYETVSSFRYETKNPRPLIRDMEITVWHEIHTAHATKEESLQEMELHMQMWDKIWADLCLPTWKIRKPVWECFPGAVGGIIMPPKFAPFQAVIVPIVYKGKEEIVNAKARDLHSFIKDRFAVKLDDRDESAGRKFYDWEIRGVPVRIELGPRDVENSTVTLVRRDTYGKTVVAQESIIEELELMLSHIEETLLARAKNMLDGQLTRIHALDEVKRTVDSGKICVVHWCGSKECFDTTNGLEPGVEALGSSLEDGKGKCFVCREDAKELLYVARTY